MNNDKINFLQKQELKRAVVNNLSKEMIIQFFFWFLPEMYD